MRAPHTPLVQMGLKRFQGFLWEHLAQAEPPQNLWSHTNDSVLTMTRLDLTLPGFSTEVLPEALHPTQQGGPESDHRCNIYPKPIIIPVSRAGSRDQFTPFLMYYIVAESTRKREKQSEGEHHQDSSGTAGDLDAKRGTGLV